MRYHERNSGRNRIQTSGDKCQNGDYQHYAAASLMARKGRYAEAVRLLGQAHDAGECSDAEALDLRARIYVQQGLYLEAESCWRRAQDIDNSNPVYVGALHRLRQMRQPIQHMYRFAVAGILLLFLGMLLWQIAVANPASSRRLEATGQSLDTIRSEIAMLRDRGVSQDKELAADLAQMMKGLQDFDARLLARIDSMPTLSGVNASQEAIIRLFSDRLTALEKEVTTQFDTATKERSAIQQKIATQEETTMLRLADIGQQQVAADTSYVEQIKAVKATMEPLRERLSGVEATLGRRLATAESSIRQDMKPLASAADVSSLARSVSELRKELGQLVVVVQELRQSGRDSDGKAGNETGTTRPGGEQGTPSGHPSDPNGDGKGESE